MSKRIDHIITVLDYIRNEYSGSDNLVSLRIKATEEIAKKNGLIRNTIFDTITRQLEPEITTVEGFEALTLDWLNNGSLLLKDILLKHSVNDGDKQKVVSFFSLSKIELLAIDDFDISFDDVYTETGKKLLIHYARERNKSLIKKAKEYWSKTAGEQGISCEVCKFNFWNTYGALGLGFIEAHHNIPISEINEATKIKIKDLTPLCSNCHRMIHKKRPWLLVEELKEKYKCFFNKEKSSNLSR